MAPAADSRPDSGSARRTVSPASTPAPTGSSRTASAHSGGVVVGRAARSGKSEGTPGKAANGEAEADPADTPGPSAQLMPPTMALGR